MKLFCMLFFTFISIFGLSGCTSTTSFKIEGAYRIELISEKYDFNKNIWDAESIEYITNNYK